MSNAKHIIGSIARTVLALVFLFSGFVKAVDPLGTVYKIEDYLKAFGGFFTDLLPLAGAAAVCLIMAEMLLGFCMLANVRTQWTSWCSLAFYAVMTPLTLYIALTNPVSDCGCFGDALVLSNWQTFWKNVVLITLVVVLLVCRKAIPQTWRWQWEIAIAAVGALLCGAIMFHSYTHLPNLDFRPYKIGNNIPELMEIPDDAEQDEYEITLIYEKDGQEQAFTLQNYPKGDSTWHFVDQRSKLIKKGYEAPIHDFELINQDYEDVTYDLLESEEVVTLIIMYDLTKTRMQEIDKVRALVGSDWNTYMVSGSGEEQVMQFCLDNDLPMERFLSCDPVTLKTIVRANPGVIQIQNGTIIEKYNLRNK